MAALSLAAPAHADNVCNFGGGVNASNTSSTTPRTDRRESVSPGVVPVPGLSGVQDGSDRAVCRCGCFNAPGQLDVMLGDVPAEVA